MKGFIYKKQWTIAVVFLLFATGCKVTFIPNYDSAIGEQIDQVAKQTDKFYLTMIETTQEGDTLRAYKHFVKEYIAIEVELNSLLTKNKIRPLNENSVRICEITLELWKKYKAEHKTDHLLENGIIKLNQKTFSDLFYAMQVAENAKKIISNPPR